MANKLKKYALTAALILCLTGCAENSAEVTETPAIKESETTVSEEITGTSDVTEAVTSDKSEAVDLKKHTDDYVIINGIQYPTDTKAMTMDGWSCDDNLYDAGIINNFTELSELTLQGNFYLYPLTFSRSLNLPKLKELNIFNYNEGGNPAIISFSDISCESIEKLGIYNLKFLENECWGFDACSIDDAGFINCLPNLKSVVFQRTKIKDYNSLTENASITELKSIENNIKGIEDLYNLAQLKNLKYLYICEFDYNLKEKAENLKKEFTDCTIKVDFLYEN